MHRSRSNSLGTMLNGTEIGAALTALEPFPIDVIGMNCGTGPKQMADSFATLRKLAAARFRAAECGTALS